MKTKILQEEEHDIFARAGDSLTVEYHGEIILTHDFKEDIQFHYVGVFEIVGGGYGGYFSVKSQR